MNRWWTNLLVAVCAVAGMSGCFPSICDNEVVRTVKHPRAATLAVIFTRGCGDITLAGITCQLSRI